MSGYNTETGIFELTSTKGSYWFRRKELPAEVAAKNNGGMKLFSDLFEYFGFEVTKLRSNYLHVKANPDQVWEVLSGQPSDPQKAAAYYGRVYLDPSIYESRPTPLAADAEGCLCAEKDIFVGAFGLLLCRHCNKPAERA